MSKTQTAFRLTEEILLRLAKEAENQDRSMNKIVERLLDKHLPKLPIQSVSKSFFCITEKETGKQTECKKQCSYCRCN